MSAEYFRRRDQARAARDKMWRPFEMRASRILERIGMPDDSQDEWSGQSYYSARGDLAWRLLAQAPDCLALREPGEATIEVMRRRVGHLLPKPPQESNDDIPF